MAKETGFYLRAFKVFFTSEMATHGMNCVFCNSAGFSSAEFKYIKVCGVNDCYCTSKM